MSSVSYQGVIARQGGLTSLTANVSTADTLVLRGLPATANVIVCLANNSIVASNVATSSLWYLNGVTSSLQAQLDSKLSSTGDGALGIGTLTANNATLGNALTLNAQVASRALTTDANKNVVASTVTATELGYLGGVTSAVQTQLDAKQATVTGAATTITSSDLTINRALLSDASGKVAVSAVTSTEMSYLGGVTSAVQTQLNAKADLAGDIFTGIVKFDSGSVAYPGIHFTTSASEAGGASGIRHVVPQTLQIITAGNIGISMSSTGLTLDRHVSVTSGRNFTMNNLSAASRVLQCNASKQVEVSAVTTTELGYLSGVTSAVQTQLNAKQATITGAATTITSSNLTINRALLSDASGKVAVSAVTNTELEYLGGVTSAVQTQLNAKAPLAAPTFTGLATAGDLQITGNLTILGNTTTVNTDQLAVEDPVVVVNSGGLAQPAGLFIQQPAGTSNVAVVYESGFLKVFSTTSAANAASYAVESYAGVRAKTVEVQTPSNGSSDVSLLLAPGSNTGLYGNVTAGGVGSVFVVASDNIAGTFSSGSTSGTSKLDVPNYLTAYRAGVYGTPQYWTSKATGFTETDAIAWTDLDPSSLRIQFMGTLHIAVTNLSTVNSIPVVGYATASVVWIRLVNGTYYELDVVPTMIHKNQNLGTFTIGKNTDNSAIRVFVDAGCSVTYQFFGMNLSTPSTPITSF